MEFKEFDFGDDRIYKTGKIGWDYFYAENSINDKFEEFLNKKYDGKVECYIKPFGSFGQDSDDVSSFYFKILDHNNSYGKYINQVHVNLDRLDKNENLYVLGSCIEGYEGHKVSGYSKKLSKQLYLDAIEFMDSIFEQNNERKL